MGVYKDHLLAASCRLDTLQQGRTPPAPSDQLLKLYTHRAARVWTAGVGLLGVSCLMVDLVWAGPRASSELLVLSWAAMLLTYPVACLAARLCGTALVRRALRPSGDVFQDLLRLEGDVGRRSLCIHIRRLELPSLALPLVAIGLLMPLTLHLLVGLVVLGIDLHQFSKWIAVSAALVGHAHLVLGVCAVLHVRNLQHALDRGDFVTGIGSGFKALMWTTVASCVPGVVLLCIPPPMVFVTGLTFIPWAFGLVAWLAQRERSAMQLATVVQQP